MMWLKQSTAFTETIGPILDSAGVEYTGAVIGDMSINKNGTEAAMASAATLTHVSNGYYSLVGTTGNADTLGRLVVRINKSTYQMPPREFMVLTAATFDTLVTNGTLASTTSGRTIVTDASGLVDANMVKAGPTGGGTAQTAKDLGAINVTNLNTLSGHDPGATLGTSTLSQTQVTGGAYSVQSSSCVLGDARIANLDATISSRTKPSDTQARVTLVDTTTINSDMRGTDNAALASNYTATRAGYLDNLSVGAVATQASVNAIQNNTRTVIVVPDVIERPDSGNETYLAHLYLYDETGNMEAPDSAPTVALANSAGTDRSGRLGSTTGTLVATGHYKWVYTNTSTDTLEQLLWEFSVVEGGATRVFGRQSLLVDTSAVDFTSSDRTNLNAICNKLPSNNIADETLVLAAVGSPMQVYTQPTGFLASTFPSGTIANTTNITGGTITTATNLTNAPTSGDLTATMKTSVATATQTGLTSQGYTTARAGYLDTLNGLVAAVWAAATSGLTTAGSVGKRLVDFVTTLVYAAAPTAVQNRQEMDSNSTQLAEIAADADALLAQATTPPTAVQIRQEMDANSTVLAEIESETDAIKVKTDQLTFTVANSVDATASIAAGAIRSAVGLATANLDAQFTTVEAAIAALGALSGAGVYAVTLTITDGANPIQNAVVNLTVNASVYSGATNSSGVVVLSPNEGAATYGVKMRAGGYQFTPTTLIVTGNQSHTYSLTRYIPNPSSVGLVTCSIYARDELFAPLAGVQFSLRLQSLPSGDAGNHPRRNPRVVASNITGLAEFVDVLPGASYSLSDGGNSISFVAPNTNFFIPSF